MARRVAVVSASSLSITELVDVCAAERARCLALFERTGDWVAAVGDPALQRLFATASQRHAWHASLWAERAPTIPVVPAPANVLTIAAADTDADRWAAYAAAMGVLLVDLAAMRARVDPELDPATARVIDLVAADARDLAERTADAAPA